MRALVTSSGRVIATNPASWLPTERLELPAYGGELTLPHPTRPGDTLRVESEVIEILPSQSRPNQAVVTVKSTTQNQAGEPVLVFAAKVLVFKRRA